MHNVERKFWRGVFLTLAAILFPFSMALSIAAVLAAWAACRLWRLVNRLTNFARPRS